MTGRVYLTKVAEPGATDGSVEASFRANAKLAYSLAVRILGSPDDAEDLLQDLFLTAQRSLRHTEHPAAVRQWFATTTVRMARRRLQRRRLFSFFSGDSPGYEDTAAPGASPEQHTLLRSVFRIIERLPVKQRIAWSLRHVEGMPLQSVAATCECSLATAKRHIAAAETFIEEAMRHG